MFGAATTFPYVPAGQVEQAVTFDSVEYVPASHTLHAVAPVPVLPVMEPAGQAVHVSVFEAAEYVPGVHTLQACAPAPALPVMEPEEQREHAPALGTVVYFPGAHGRQDWSDTDEPELSMLMPGKQSDQSVHEGALLTLENFPFSHAAHVRSAEVEP